MRTHQVRTRAIEHSNGHARDRTSARGHPVGDSRKALRLRQRHSRHCYQLIAVAIATGDVARGTLGTSKLRIALLSMARQKATPALRSTVKFLLGCYMPIGCSAPRWRAAQIGGRRQLRVIGREESEFAGIRWCVGSVDHGRGSLRAAPRHLGGGSLTIAQKPAMHWTISLPGGRQQSATVLQPSSILEHPLGGPQTLSVQNR